MMTERITVKPGKGDTRIATVRLKPGEQIFIVDDTDHYRLGGQLDDVVPGHVITEAQRVHWCHFEQCWRSE